MLAAELDAEESLPKARLPRLNSPAEDAGGARQRLCETASSSQVCNGWHAGFPFGLLGFVDPGLGRHGGRLRAVADGALGMLRVGGRERAASSGYTFGCAAARHVSRGEQTEAAVMMLEVVPVEEVPAEAACVLGHAEAVGEAGPALESLEVAIRERVVVRDEKPRASRPSTSRDRGAVSAGRA